MRSKALQLLTETLKKIPDGERSVCLPFDLTSAGRFIERDKIVIKSVIGHGAGGVVYQGVLSGSYKVALKRQKSDSDQALQDLQREIDIRCVTGLRRHKSSFDDTDSHQVATCASQVSSSTMVSGATKTRCSW